ncbi:MAG TPA: response regulator transcription factor, partial [Chloroflexota bacterium]|nr:response regulator transcription factor [Chloroflexota bacterium]
EGFDVRKAGNGREAISQVTDFRPQLVLLDVMMPELDGFEVATRLQAQGQRVPILFLTARDATEDKIRGLTLGGDDYVTKPFSLEELIARVRAILRRTDDRPGDSHLLTYADLAMDEDSHEVTRGGAIVSLTSTEYNLLRYLLSNAQRVLTRGQIIEHVWEYDFDGDANVLDTYISYLRKKIDAYDPALIQTVRGVGYVLRLPRS